MSDFRAEKGKRSMGDLIEPESKEIFKTKEDNMPRTWEPL
jgi:hypothetical protein